MDRSELDSLKNELKQIYDQSISVINQDGFLAKSQVPSGKKYTILRLLSCLLTLEVQRY